MEGPLVKEIAMLTTFGLDIAKRVFQLHTVDPDTGEIQRLKLRRVEMVPFFANRGPCVVAMPAEVLTTGAVNCAASVTTSG